MTSPKPYTPPSYAGEIIMALVILVVGFGRVARAAAEPGILRRAAKVSWRLGA